MKKKKARFNSLSTPGNRQDASNYLVELVFLRRNHGIKLPPKFWQQTRHKFRYRREIQACRKFIKKYGEALVLSVAISNYITTWTNYANVEALLQRLEESIKLKQSTKDISPVLSIKAEPVKDIRAKHGLIKNTKPQKGLFDRLKEMKDESTN